MSLFDWVANRLRPRNSPDSGDTPRSESTETPEMTGGPTYNLHKFSRSELFVAIMTAQRLPGKAPRYTMNAALAAVERYRKSENKRRRQAQNLRKPKETPALPTDTETTRSIV